jgi:esterase/lipase
MFKKRWLLLIPVLLVVIYLLGPHPARPVYAAALPVVPAAPAELEAYVAAHEAAHHLKPDNQARIVWADSSKRKTKYVLLYLHGFSSSQADGEPVHRQFAKEYGCNLYLSRLAEHGVDTTEPMVNLTAAEYWNSAKEAYAIARQLGDSVLIVGCSTGGTLALQLAAAYPHDPIKGLLLLSPNIAINDGAAWVLNNPWGLQIARIVLKSHYKVSEDTRPVYKQYWTYRYRIEALVSLEELLETTMTTATFSQVKQPVLLLYYYKDEIHQDSVVKVSAARSMFTALGTAPDRKREVAMPLTGNHVIGSYIKSHDLPGVEREMEGFATQVLGMHKAATATIP